MASFSRVNVGTTPVEIAPVNGNRKSIVLINRGTADIYIADTNQVSATTGIQFRPQEQLTFMGDASAIWCIASSGTQRVDIIEVA